jgi:polyisoprenoid-binding protein YceI
MGIMRVSRGAKLVYLCFLCIAAASSLTAQPAPGAATDTFVIVANSSRASYAVDEIFLRENNRLFTAVGITPGVSGEIVFNRGTPKESRVGQIFVDLRALKSDSERRDRALREKHLDTHRFPFARLMRAHLRDVPTEVQEGLPFRYKLESDLFVHGVIRRTEWQGEAVVAGDTLRGFARAVVKMSDFGIEVPNLLSLRSADEVKLEIQFVAVRQRGND